LSKNHHLKSKVRVTGNCFNTLKYDPEIDVGIDTKYLNKPNRAIWWEPNERPWINRIYVEGGYGKPHLFW